MSRITAELRARIAESSRNRCAYCQMPGPVVGPLLQIDHVIPRTHAGSDDEHNLCLACPHCNRHKSDRIRALDPETSESVPLFNPCQDTWSDHFMWDEDGSVIRGTTLVGRATVATLNMNHPELVAARRIWVIAGWHPLKD